MSGTSTLGPKPPNPHPRLLLLLSTSAQAKNFANDICSHLIEVVVVLAFWFLMKRENARRDKIQGTEEKDLDATAFGDLTDRENLNFRYIY